MAYTDVSEMAADQDLRQRIYACLASMGNDNVSLWVDRWVWEIVARDPRWAQAWSTLGASPGGRPGWDADVITDEMILERVREVRDDKGANL